MTEPQPPHDPFGLTGTVLDGRFRIERVVAEGGFGVVYYAIQAALDRPVALKVLKTPPGLDPAARAHFHEKFAAEAKTIARMRHPNIVDVYDFGVSPLPAGQAAPWMALEWLTGSTLEDHLAARRGRGGRSPAEVLGLLRPVFQAFAYAHRSGVAHRDIKPANIMIVSLEAGGTTTKPGQLLRVLDFGIAKIMNSDEQPGSGTTRTAGLPAFSPLYAAPEQVAFGRTGPWTDVHALGLIVTEMLVDELPYQAQDMQLFEAAMAAARPTPATRGRKVGPWEDVIGRALALSPGERFANAAEFLSALESGLDGAMSAAAATSARSGGVREAVVGVGQTVPMPVDPPRAAARSSTMATPANAWVDPGSARSRRWRIAGIAATIVVAAAAAAIWGVRDAWHATAPAPQDIAEPPAAPAPAPAPAPTASPSAPPPTAPGPTPVPAPVITPAPAPPPEPAGLRRSGEQAAASAKPRPSGRPRRANQEKHDGRPAPGERLPIE